MIKLRVEVKPAAARRRQRRWSAGRGRPRRCARARSRRRTPARAALSHVRVWGFGQKCVTLLSHVGFGASGRNVSVMNYDLGVGASGCGVGCGVWGMGCGCGVWGVGCGVWGVGCGVWGGVWGAAATWATASSRDVASRTAWRAAALRCTCGDNRLRALGASRRQPLLQQINGVGVSGGKYRATWKRASKAPMSQSRSTKLWWTRASRLSIKNTLPLSYVPRAAR